MKFSWLTLFAVRFLKKEWYLTTCNIIFGCFRSCYARNTWTIWILLKRGKQLLGSQYDSSDKQMSAPWTLQLDRIMREFICVEITAITLLWIVLFQCFYYCGQSNLLLICCLDKGQRFFRNRRSQCLLVWQTWGIFSLNDQIGGRYLAPISQNNLSQISDWSLIFFSNIWLFSQI